MPYETTDRSVGESPARDMTSCHSHNSTSDPTGLLLLAASCSKHSSPPPPNDKPPPHFCFLSRPTEAVPSITITIQHSELTTAWFKVEAGGGGAPYIWIETDRRPNRRPVCLAVLWHCCLPCVSMGRPRDYLTCSVHDEQSSLHGMNHDV